MSKLDMKKVCNLKKVTISGLRFSELEITHMINYVVTDIINNCKMIVSLNFEEGMIMIMEIGDNRGV